MEKFAGNEKIDESILHCKKEILSAIKELCEAQEGSYGIDGLTLAEKKPYIDLYISLYREVKALDSSYNADYANSPDPFEKPRNSFELSKRDQSVKTHWQSFDLDEQRRIAKERTERYWAEHKEEKAKYETRLAEIAAELVQFDSQVGQYDTQIADIKRELSVNLPVEVQLAEVKRSQDALTAQKSKLGFFAGKQKKLLQEQIDALVPEIESLELASIQQKQTVKNSVTERVNTVDAEKKPLLDRISQLEAEQNAINAELTKAR